jgi:hypothetical protein
MCRTPLEIALGRRPRDDMTAVLAPRSIGLSCGTVGRLACESLLFEVEVGGFACCPGTLCRHTRHLDGGLPESF